MAVDIRSQGKPAAAGPELGQDAREVGNSMEQPHDPVFMKSEPALEASGRYANQKMSEFPKLRRLV